LTDDSLQKLFQSKFAPLQTIVLPSVSINIETDSESYFEEVYEPASIVSQEDMITSLMAIWKRNGMEKLVALEPDLRKIAKQLRAPESAEQQISDFIYAMY